jgi:predicted homoserine dehydrogenase-like protein
MILVDSALRRREASGHPIGVAVVGTGFMGRGLVNQVVNATPGMRVVAAVNRTVAHAERALTSAGVSDWEYVQDTQGVDKAAARGVPAVTDDVHAVLASPAVDAVVEATGAVEYGCVVATGAIDAGKHVVLLNAEVDATVGPLLKKRADKAGVVYTGCDGDQPGVQMNLVRFVRGIGLEPLVVGNIKGLQDPYRTPTTQADFARRWGQNPAMVTSFADGTKISFEQATVANAVGLTIERRGMRGADHAGHVDDLVDAYDLADLRDRGGVVDYVVGSRPGPGVFVLAAHDDPQQRHYLDLYKLGRGPLYSFYTPYHLCHFEVPASVGRAVLFGDATIAPLAGPRVEVVATAKRDLAAGQRLDGLGGYDTYGQAETAAATAAGRLLPMGVAEGCLVRRDVARDEVLTYHDVDVPPGRLVDALRAEQAQEFGLQASGLQASGTAA